MKLSAIFPAVLLISLLAGAMPPVAVGQETRAETKTVATMREVLLSQTGKRVAVRLNGDQDIEGTVISVGVDTVLLSKVTGKDYYDAVISISKIGAILYKAR
jgi:hypothetical protein